MAGDSRIATENFLRLNFTPKSGVTAGTEDTLAMSCDQIVARYNVSISGASATENRCPAQNELTGVASLAVGDSYQGGIIAYIYFSGDPGYVEGQQHGFIAAPSDQSASTYWFDGTQQNTGATAMELGAGLSNTTNIVSVHGTGNYAASICSSFSLNGYSDWFLPSNSELIKMKINQALIGGFTAASRYWSSSEVDTDNAYSWYFNSGVGYGTPKGYLGKVRAIRYF